MKILSDTEFGVLCRALLEYSMNGTPIEGLPGLAAAFAERAMMQEDAFKRNYAERCEKNRLNGVKGGRPVREEPKNPTVLIKTQKPEWFRSKPKKPKQKQKQKIIPPIAPLRGA